MKSDHEQLRLLPSIDELLQTPHGQELIAHFSRPLTVRALRNILSDARSAIRSGGTAAPSADGLLEAAEELPSGESLAAELTRFLREREQNGEDESAGGPAS